MNQTKWNVTRYFLTGISGFLHDNLQINTVYRLPGGAWVILHVPSFAIWFESNSVLYVSLCRLPSSQYISTFGYLHSQPTLHTRAEETTNPSWTDTLHFHVLYSDLHMLSLNPVSVLCKKLPWFLQFLYQNWDVRIESVTQLPSLHAVKKNTRSPLLPSKLCRWVEKILATIEIPAVFHNIVAFYLVRWLWQRGTNLCGLLGLAQFERAIWHTDQTLSRQRHNNRLPWRKKRAGLHSIHMGGAKGGEEIMFHYKYVVQISQTVPSSFNQFLVGHCLIK